MLRCDPELLRCDPELSDIYFHGYATPLPPFSPWPIISADDEHFGMGKKLDQSGKWKDAAKGELRGVFSVKKDGDGRDVIKMGEPVYTLQGYSVPKDYVRARNESIAIRDGTKK